PGHVGRRGHGVLGVAAIAGAPQPAHDRQHFRPLGQYAGGVRHDRADSLDAAYRRRLGPLALAHMRLRMVDTERLDGDHDLLFPGYRGGDLPDLEDFGPAWFRDDDRAHPGLPLHRPP